jgi:hypothetical protein
MVRVPNQGEARVYSRVGTTLPPHHGRHDNSVILGRAQTRAARYLAAGVGAVVAYFLRNLSTRPAVSTIFCLPV